MNMATMNRPTLQKLTFSYSVYIFQMGGLGSLNCILLMSFGNYKEIQQQCYILLGIRARYLPIRRNFQFRSLNEYVHQSIAADVMSLVEK